MGVVLFYLTSGLFLGWSLGANDASNVFGTAVGSRMVRFSTAAWICSIFVILGAVFGGAGAAHGLGKLGAVNALAGSFTVAFSAALTVLWMTKAGLPVSTTQAIVGAIVGWNFFSGSATDWSQLTKIVSTWIACPLLGAGFAAVLYKLTAATLAWTKPHMLRQDWLTRWGLLLAGAFGAYSLGANNIGNVMGVFVDSSPFSTVTIAGSFTISGTQQLFFLGSLAIAVGVFTYSKKVMMTVGNKLMPLTPVGAWVVVVAHSLVLFIFSSSELEQLLIRLNLPPIPLIPVSSSQAVIGAVIGIALVQARGKAIRQVNWGHVANVASGWVATPITGGILCFVLLFVVQNVFQDQVYTETYFTLSDPVLKRLQDHGLQTKPLQDLKDQKVAKARAFRELVRERIELSPEDDDFVLSSAEIYRTVLDEETLSKLDRQLLSAAQIEAIESLAPRQFEHKWQLVDGLSAASSSWRKREETIANKTFNQAIDAQTAYVLGKFHPQAAP